MTDPDPTPTPLPVDVSGIDEPLPDPGHEAIRSAALAAIVTVAGMHQALVNTVAELRQTVADLTARVAGLEPAPEPEPAPTPDPVPDPATT